MLCGDYWPRKHSEFRFDQYVGAEVQVDGYE